MPLTKPQHLKSLKTIGLQPEKMSNRIDVIMCMDLAGKKGVDIARDLGLTESRISIIRNSPMYVHAISEERERLRELYRDKQTDRLTSGDPVEEALKGAALNAARKKIELMKDGKSEFVQLSAAGDILDRAGYKAHQEKTKMTIEVTERMAERFEKALKYMPDKGSAQSDLEYDEQERWEGDGPTIHDRETKIRVEKEMS